MLHLKPLAEKDATDTVKKLYREIREVLEVSSVPLLFQYIANYELYFQYLWERMKANIHTTVFRDMLREVADFSHMTIGIIYTPTNGIPTFIQTLAPLEKHNLNTTVQTLMKLNTTLLILSVATRESMKGLVVPQQFLPQGPSSSTATQDIFLEEIMDQNHATTSTGDTKKGAAMLVPLFGHDAPAIARYPTFFTLIASEMEHLTATEAYLKTRVELEHITLLYTATLPVPLATSYREVEKYIGKEPYFYELIHLLKNVFPSIFPRLLLTSTVMQKALI